MYSEPTELRLTGYLTESIWIRRFKIKYVDIKHQLEDILTKGHFTRDEWNNLLHLCNICHFSSVCCSQNFSLTSCTKTMSKRMQQRTGEERIVAKSKPTFNLDSKTEASSLTVLSPNASTQNESKRKRTRIF